MIIQTDFGYNEVHIGNLVVYTGKIRVKGNHWSHNPNVKFEVKGEYTIFSFETINKELGAELRKKLSTYCKQLAQQKLDSKYAWCSN